MTLSSVTVLVVDDCEAHNYALTRLLENAGATVIQAFTGSEALRLSEEKPSAILLDINLPDVNGFEVCRRLRANPKTASIPVVLVSAISQDATARTMAENVGAKSLVFYPIEKDQLLSVIRGQIAKAIRA